MSIPINSSLSRFASYDHEFVCLSNGLDPVVVSVEEGLALNKLDFTSSGEIIKQQVHCLPGILAPYVNLLASTYDWKGYKKRNQDLGRLTPVQLVSHFLEHGITEPRHWIDDAALMDRRFAWAIHSMTDCHLRANMQVIVHVYYFSVLCRLLPYLKILARLGAKIYLLVVNQSISCSALDNILATLYTGAVEHQWIRLTNHGEDWSSFHAAYNLGIFESEGVTFKIQTKLSKNLGTDGGSSWIDEALGPICGNQAAVSKVLSQLIDGTHVVASSSAVRRKGFGENPQLVCSLAERVCDTQPALLSNIDFAAGSMFAVRNKLVREFYSAIGNIDYSKEYSEGSAYCGRYVGHAVERVFFYYCTSRRISRDSPLWLT
jgi:hypothetical protein